MIMAECNDRKCAVHGDVKVRGNVLTGRVVSAKRDRTVTVERKLTKYVQKYERYSKSRSRVAAHNPACVNAKEGDMVKIGETRKLSKTKSFVVLGIAKEEGKAQKGAE
ncbi:MAG: 30S ribosomal protein S17 [Candidatus Diapherotrites archaeon]